MGSFFIDCALSVMRWWAGGCLVVRHGFLCGSSLLSVAFLQSDIIAGINRTKLITYPKNTFAQSREPKSNGGLKKFPCFYAHVA